MSKLAIGLLIGFVLGFGIARWMTDATPATSEAIAGHPASATLLHHEDGAGADRSSQDASPAPGAAAQVTHTPRETQTLPETDASAALTPSAAGGTPLIDRSAIIRESLGERVAVPVADRLKGFLEQTDPSGKTLGQLHEELEQESEDYAWAHQMEQNIRQHLMQQRNGIVLDVLSVECRTSLCEIQALNPVQGGPNAFGAALQSMTQQPWWDFEKMHAHSGDDASGGQLLAILIRRDR